MTASVEVIRRVFDDNESAFLEIGPHPDYPDAALELRTGGDQTSKDWFGEQSFSLSPDFAIALGLALVASGQAMNDEKK